MDGQRAFPPRVPVSRGAQPDDGDAAAAMREIELWTTRDGREIPLDEMSDDHIGNAVRVLSKWRNGLKRARPDDPVIVDLTAALDRFKRLDRDRRRAAKASGYGTAEPNTAAAGPVSRLKASQMTKGDGPEGEEQDRRTKPKSKWPKRPMGQPKRVPRGN